MNYFSLFTPARLEEIRSRCGIKSGPARKSQFPQDKQIIRDIQLPKVIPSVLRQPKPLEPEPIATWKNLQIHGSPRPKRWTQYREKRDRSPEKDAPEEKPYAAKIRKIVRFAEDVACTAPQEQRTLDGNHEQMVRMMSSGLESMSLAGLLATKQSRTVSERDDFLHEEEITTTPVKRYKLRDIPQRMSKQQKNNNNKKVHQQVKKQGNLNKVQPIIFRTMSSCLDKMLHGDCLNKIPGVCSTPNVSKPKSKMTDIEAKIKQDEVLTRKSCTLGLPCHSNCKTCINSIII